MGAAGIRCLDVGVAIMLGILVVPVLALLALWIRIAAGPPVFHRETRLGRHGRPFTLVKLRSLRAGSEQDCSVAAEGDPRITRVGGWLRRSRMDELPQLGLVLVGHMSLVGPRPLKPEHAAHLPPETLRVLLAARPGITGPSALAFLSDDAVLGERPEAASPDALEALYAERLLPEKARLDAAYLSRRSVLGDVRWLLRTLRALVSPTVRRASRARVERLLED